MNDKPTVAVVVPTYNNEDTVGETVRMLASQTLLPDRIVFCDKSSDGTRAVVERVRDEVPVSVELFEQRSDGVAGAYDELWEFVGPDYDVLATVQTNVQVEPDWLERHVEVYQRQPDVGLVTCGGGGGEWDRRVAPSERTYYTGRCVSFRNGTLEAVDGWDPNFLRGEDWDMQIRLAGAGIESYRIESPYRFMGDRTKVDPEITFAKAQRRPTSITFLRKYGRWYLTYHPTHVIHDGLCVSATVAAGLTVLTLPTGLPSLLFTLMFTCITVFYLLGHAFMSGPIDESYIVQPLRKLVLNTLSVGYAIHRTAGVTDWNMVGFNSETIPSYDASRILTRLGVRGRSNGED